jgi:hypothetical protein
MLRQEKVMQRACFQLQPFEGMTGKEEEGDSERHIVHPLPVNELKLQNNLNLEVQIYD